jgi:myxalamid-type polyketide synthase MxaE and MxaD
MAEQGSVTPVAVVGVACRFPGAESPEALWRLLAAGADAITEVPPSRWDVDRLYDPRPDAPGKTSTRWGGFLEGVDMFDCDFFGISPREAAGIDPQQRLVLELAWEGLEDAGCVPESLDGSKTGVFVGISTNDYGRDRFRHAASIDRYAGTGNALSVAANRVSYALGLRGPSVAVDTACSSSLVAVHLACRSLGSGESTLAIAAGVNLVLSPEITINFSKAGVMAPDGRCKTFDARADGYVRSDGAGVVVLKALEQALADGDRVYAVIRSSAVNHDGRTNGLMAPSPSAQEALVREAHALAGVTADDVQYVEAHGTGTALGDAVEAKALGSVFAPGRRGERPLLLGSIKTNIGHAEAAAGIAGLLKVALALDKRMLPPSLHFERPNPHIPFEELRLDVARTLEPWPADPGEACAGVSSFGFGGTNAHVVVAEAPVPVARDVAPRELDEEDLLLPISTRRREALLDLAQAYRRRLDGADRIELEDVCSTAALRRGHRDYRLCLVVRSASDAVGGLRRATVPRRASSRRPLVFVYSGHGSQWAGMGRALLADEPVFAAAIREVDALVGAHAGWSVLDLLESGEAAVEGLADVGVAQVAIFTVQVGLTALWGSWGVVPDAVIGHSMGEVAAAHAAEALDLDDAVDVTVTRSRILEAQQGLGAMAVTDLPVGGDAPELEELDGKVELAAANSPVSTIWSGERAVVHDLVERLRRQGRRASLLDISAASHCALLDDFRDEMLDGLRDLRPTPPRIPFFSSLLGGDAGALPLDAAYWWRNAREPVWFARAVEALASGGEAVFLELSPHPVIGSAVAQTLTRLSRDDLVLASLRRDEPERRHLLETAAALYVDGRSLDWQRLAPPAGRFVRLPTNPWQRERHWLDAPADPAAAMHDGHPLLRRRFSPADDPRTQYWEVDVDLADPSLSYLGDHRVHGAALLPATAYCEMALEGGSEVLGTREVELAEVEFHRALFLPDDGSLPVQLSVRRLDGSTARFEVRSRDEGAGWAHASGTIRVASDAPARARPHATDGETIPGGEYYTRLRDGGYDYGPSFRSIAHVTVRESEAVAELRVPEALHDELPRYRVHPACLDAALQVLGSAVPAGGHGRPSAPLLPVAIERLRVGSPAGPRLVSEARVRGEAVETDDRVQGDVLLFDEAGELVAEVSGLELRRTGLDALDGSLYHVSWEQADAAAGAEAAARWVILGNPDGIGAALAARVAATAESVEVVPGVPDDLVAVLDSTLRDSSPSRVAVVHLWSFDGPQPTDASGVAEIEAACERGCRTALDLAQALVGHPGAAAARVWFVSRGAQSVDGEDVAVAQAPLWGFARALAQEQPALWGGLVDVDPEAPAEEAAEQVLRAVSAVDGEDQLAFRAGRRYRARLARAPRPAPRAALPLREDATYLVTGGLGELGLLVARWMVEEGARNLILVSRRGLPPPGGDGRPDERVAEVAALEELGATVETGAVDVADGEQLEALLARLERDGRPPLRGVVHAAGVVDLATVTELDAARLSEGLRAKVSGGWLLHRLLADTPLDFFVLFSSATSVIGSPRLAAYAAANEFLDALAHHRVASGLPALSVNWALWGQAGVAARTLREGHPLIRGAGEITTDAGLRLLGRLLADPRPQVAVIPVRWDEWRRAYPQFSRAPFLADVFGGAEAVDTALTTAGLTRDELLAKEPHERAAALEEVLRAGVARVAGLDVTRLSAESGLNTLGVDSLMALELKNQIDRGLGIDLPLVELLRGATIGDLAGRIVELVETSVPAPTAAADDVEIPEDVDELDDREVDELLQRMLGRPWQAG